MALVPGVYSRNRMFSLFAQAGMQRAKSRAAMLRGVASQLSRACAVSVTYENVEGRAPTYVLRYQIPALRLTRVTELSRVELATLRILASRTGSACLPPADEDRALIDTTLAGLLSAEQRESEPTCDKAPESRTSVPSPAE